MDEHEREETRAIYGGRKSAESAHAGIKKYICTLRSPPPVVVNSPERLSYIWDQFSKIIQKPGDSNRAHLSTLKAP